MSRTFRYSVTATPAEPSIIERQIQQYQEDIANLQKDADCETYSRGYRNSVKKQISHTKRTVRALQKALRALN